MTDFLTDREKLSPFLPDILTASAESGERASLLAALVMRESGATWAAPYFPKGDPHGYGDQGYGHGICQIDIRWHKDWLQKAEWWLPIVSLRKACDILRGNRTYLSRVATAPSPKDPLFERCVYAAYNCGPHQAKMGWALHGDPDHFSAGSSHSAGKGDYSAWVFAKADDLEVQIHALRRMPRVG